jgi:hypothetical protein
VNSDVDAAGSMQITIEESISTSFIEDTSLPHRGYLSAVCPELQDHDLDLIAKRKLRQCLSCSLIYIRKTKPLQPFDIGGTMSNWACRILYAELVRRRPM